MPSKILNRASRATVRASLLLSAGVLACAPFGTSAHAQVAPPVPIRPRIDANGVDLFNDVLVADAPGITVGAKGSSLSYNTWNHGSGWSDSTMVFLTLSGSTMTVALGEASDTFSVSGTTYTAIQGNGATLTYNSTAGTYTYTARDGTVVTFGNYGNAWMAWGNTKALVSSIHRPNGENLAYSWTSQQYCKTWKPGAGGYIYTTTGYMYRLASITSSFGYQLSPQYSSYQYTYESSQPQVQPNFTLWSTPTGVKLYNLANSTTTPAVSISFSDQSVGNYVYHFVTDALGNQWKYRYLFNALSQVAGITTPANSAETVTAVYTLINNVEQLTSIANAAGTTTYSTSDSGNVRTVTVTDAQSHVSKYTFDIPTGQMTAYTDPLSHTWTNEIDSFGRITQVTKPEGNYVQTTYDSRGNVTQQTAVAKSGSGLANIVTTAGFDSTCTYTVKCNQPNWTKDALGNETDYTYDTTYGVVTSMTAPPDPNNLRPQARFTYTLMQAYYLNAGSIVASGQNTDMLTGISVCRTEAGAALSGTPGVGPFTLSGTATCLNASDETRTTISYGPQVRGTANSLYPVSQIFAAGDNSVSATTSQSYDNMGNVVSTVGALGSAQTSYAYYDAGRRLLGNVTPDPDGAGPRTPAAVKYTYNADSAVTETQVGTVPDQTANSFTNNFTEAYHSALTLDTYDRPTRSAVVSGGTNYAVGDQLYDTLGRAWCSVQYMNMAAVPGSVATTCAPSQTNGPYGSDRVVQSTFDADSRVLSTSDSVGALGTVSYSANGNQLTALDGKNNLTSYTYDGFDRLSQTNFPVATQGGNASDPNNYETLTYDAGSHVLSQRKRDGTTDTFTYDNLNRAASWTSNTTTRSLSYNLVNNVLSSYANTGTPINFTYDALGRKTSEVEAQGTISSSYDAAGDRTRLTWWDGFYVNYNYDTIGGVTSIQENGATSGVGVLATYSYDNLGRRSGVAYGNGTGRSYAYDGIGRLAGLQLTFPNGAYNQLIGGVGGSGTPIGYTPSSQIASIARSNDAYAWTGSYNVNRAYATNGLNQYSSSGGVALGYDLKGNLTSSGSSTYGYNSINWLNTAPGGSLAYDIPGRQSYYSTSNGVLYFDYDGPNHIVETNSGGTIVNRYVFGPGTDEPIVWYQGSGTSARSFLQADERGSIVAVSDSSGNVQNINTYDEFGIPASTNATYASRFGYTGQSWLPEVGLYYFKARMYSPTLGRFMQADPIGYGDGLNMYNYAHSDSINGSDPTGLEDKSPSTGTGVGGSGSSALDQTYSGTIGIDLGNGYSYIVNCQGSGCSGATNSQLVNYALGQSDNLQNAFQTSGDFSPNDIFVTAGKLGSNDGPSALTLVSTTSIGRPLSPQNDEIVVTGKRHRYVLNYLNPCPAPTVFNYFKQAGNSAPGAPAAREGLTQRIVLTGGNPISQYVNSATGTIINTTLPGHRYFPGTVKIQVTPLSDQTSTTTITGEGTGAHSEENVQLGELFFGSQAAGAQDSCGR